MNKKGKGEIAIGSFSAPKLKVKFEIKKMAGLLHFKKFTNLRDHTDISLDYFEM